MERQGFGIRLGAFLIDFVFTVVINMFIGLIFGLGFGFRMGTAAAAAGAGYTLVSTLVTLGYWSTEIFNAASPGKMLLGLKIAGESAVPATQNQLIMRYLFKNSPNLL